MMLTTLLARRLLRDTLIGLAVFAAMIIVVFAANGHLAARQSASVKTAAAYERSTYRARELARLLEQAQWSQTGIRIEQLQTAISRLDVALAELRPGRPGNTWAAAPVRTALQQLSRRGSAKEVLAERQNALALIEGRLLPKLRKGAALHREIASADSERLESALVLSAILSIVGVLGLGALMLRSMVSRVETATWELLEAHQQAEHLAFHDPLTGLPNRRYLTDHLNRTLARAKRRGMDVGLLHVDLDRFKEINDTLGHSAGDEALKLAAEAMSGALRRGDFLARVGGDEFAVVVTEIGGVAALSTLAERLIGSVRLVRLPTHFPSALGLSAGIAIAEPEDGYDPADLLRRADEALYRAKDAGRGVHRLDLAEPGRRENLRATG